MSFDFHKESILNPEPKLDKKNYKINLKNNSKLDLLKVSEDFCILNNWINDHFFFQRKSLKKFLFPIAIFVYLKFFKKKKVLESNLFLIKYGLKNMKKIYFKKKKTSIGENYNKFKFKLKTSENFKINVNLSTLEKLIAFLEANNMPFFLNTINRKMAIFTKENNYLNCNFFKNKNSKVYRIPKLQKNNFINQETSIEKRTDSMGVLGNTILKKRFNLKIFSIDFAKKEVCNCMENSPDFSKIISGFESGQALISDLCSDNNIRNIVSIKSSSSVFSSKFLNHQNLFLTGCIKGELNLWSVFKTKLLLKYQTDLCSIWDIDVSKNDIFCTANQNSSLSVWLPDREFSTRTFYGHTLDVNTVRWHPSGNFLISGSRDHSIRIWDIRMGKSVGFFKSFDKSVESLGISPNGYEISFGGISNFIDTWDIRMGGLMRRINENGKNCSIDNIGYVEKTRDLFYIKNRNIFKLWSCSDLISIDYAYGLRSSRNSFISKNNNLNIYKYKHSKLNYGILLCQNLR